MRRDDPLLKLLGSQGYLKLAGAIGASNRVCTVGDCIASLAQPTESPTSRWNDTAPACRRRARCLRKAGCHRNQWKSYRRDVVGVPVVKATLHLPLSEYPFGILVWCNEYPADRVSLAHESCSRHCKAAYLSTGIGRDTRTCHPRGNEARSYRWGWVTRIKPGQGWGPGTESAAGAGSARSSTPANGARLMLAQGDGCNPA